ncbi:beta-galactosidase 3-like [Euphorbia lathyris]|uniref:beta-galactosidase 3-like n=1 Tax=Euphorbia lathyris TaxID=212925 RepID=UPI003313A326
MGLQNMGDTSSHGKWDLFWQKWTYQVGLKGEAMDVVSRTSVSSVGWIGSIGNRTETTTIDMVYFNALKGNEPLALDMERWVRVKYGSTSIWRYWTAYANGDCKGCNCAGTFRPPKCQVGSGKPTQKW